MSSLAGMDSLGEQNLLMRAWSFVDSAPTKVYISMGLCATERVLKDLNFIPKSLKRAMQDFSPLLWKQPDMRQRNHRLPTRRGTDITAYDITGISDQPALLLESLLFPLSTIVPRSLQLPSSATTSTSRFAEVSWQHSRAWQAGAASWPS